VTTDHSFAPAKGLGKPEMRSLARRPGQHFSDEQMPVKTGVSFLG
jgi:hypothetical protein